MKKFALPLLLAVFASPLSASIVIEFGNTAAYDGADVVFVSTSDVTSTDRSLFLRSPRGALQTFTVAETIEAVNLSIVIERAWVGESFTFRLVEFTADPSAAQLSASAVAATTVLATETFTFDLSMGATVSPGDNSTDALGTLIWTLPTPVMLNSGATTNGNNYALVIDGNDPDTSGLRWSFAEGDVYANQSNPRSAIGYWEGGTGGFEYESDAFGTSGNNVDLSLAINAIPEPAHLTLLGGLTALGFIAWRRRR